MIMIGQPFDKIVIVILDEKASCEFFRRSVSMPCFVVKKSPKFQSSMECPFFIMEELFQIKTELSYDL